MTRVRDEDVAWIRQNTFVGDTIRSAVPSGFDVYGLLDLDEDRATEDVLLQAVAPEDDAELIAGWLARGRCKPRPGDDHVLYSGWRYRLRAVDAAALRGLPAQGEGGFPDLLFPLDRSWVVSLLWDDSWRSIGCTDALAREIARRLPSFERIDAATPIATTGRDVH